MVEDSFWRAPRVDLRAEMFKEGGRGETKRGGRSLSLEDFKDEDNRS